MVEEIKRLVMNETVEDWLPEYTFHRENCPINDTTPFHKSFLIL
ncbi:hypothetical protein [Alkalibacillus silvisoli]